MNFKWIAIIAAAVAAVAGAVVFFITPTDKLPRSRLIARFYNL